MPDPVAEFQAIFDLCPHPVWLENQQNIVFLNQCARRLVGEQAAGQLLQGLGNQLSANVALKYGPIASWPITISGLHFQVSIGAEAGIESREPDLAARRKAEQALLRSEQRFRAIFDQTFQFIGLLNPEGILLEANQTALTFGGVTRDEVIGRPVWETFWWQISAKTQHKLRNSVIRAKSGEFVRYEVDVWGAGRAVATVDFSLRPMADENGRVDLIIAEGRDVTELHRAESLVHAEGEKRRLEAVLRSMTKGVVIADPAGNVLSMNPAALDLLGLTTEQQAIRPLLEFREFEIRALDGAVLPVSEWPLSRVLNGETFAGFEVEVRRLDTGKRFIGSYGGAPVRDDSGRVILVVLTIRDVTHQHEIEGALRQANRERDFALQAGQMRIWRVEFDGEKKLPDVSGAMLGLAPDSDISSHEQMIRAVHPDDLERVRKFGEQMRGGASQEIEYRVQAKDGQHQWQASRGQAIVSERGDLIGLTGVTWDITERKKTEAEIQRMNSSLHQLSGELLRLQDEERRRLARELHDGPVQTLSATAMNLSVLARSPILTSNKKERKMAEECLGWVKECSEEMRSLSYLLHPPILDELGLTSALRGWIVGFADRTGLDVEMELEEAGRLGAETETALFRIVQEALGNAHRHSKSSNAAVRLHRAGGSIVLEVEDTGCGIPADVLEGRSTSHVLGVGIRGMRERARRLGGEASIRSGAGLTTIRIVLPVPKGL